MTRTAMFLDKVQTLSRIEDFLVGSSQNLMASGIWATVKITFKRRREIRKLDKDLGDTVRDVLLGASEGM